MKNLFKLNASKLTDNQQLAIDAYYKKTSGTAKFDTSLDTLEFDELIRKQYRKITGITPEDDPTAVYYKFMANKIGVYAITSEMMGAVQMATLPMIYQDVADFKTDAFGDKTYFTVQDRKLFDVYVTANGVGQVDRQRLTAEKFQVPTSWKQITTYADWETFFAGEVDWAFYMDKVNKSLINQVGIDIASAVYGAYSSLGTNFKTTGAYDSDTLDDMIAYVKASGEGVLGVKIYGSEGALKQITNTFGYSDKAKDKANEIGNYGAYNGNGLYKLPQAFLNGTETFAVNRNYIAILPDNGEKIVKVVKEGRPMLFDVPSKESNDLELEFTVRQKWGVAAITAGRDSWAMYKFS